MSTLASLQDALRLQKEFLAACQELLGFDPQDATALSDKIQTEAEIKSLEAKISSAKQNNTPTSIAPSPPSGSVPPPPPAHDALPPPPPSEETYVPFNVKDVVMAKYSEDKQWYPATIITKTGSSTDPVYTVTFKGYNNTETKRKFEVRAVESKKRKAEGPPTTSTPQSPAPPRHVTNGAVISAAPSVDTSLVQKRVPSKVSDGPTRLPPEPKKLKGNKALDKAKSSWNAWQQSGPKKGPVASSSAKKKDSQFRTADLPNAKVGFVGSGKPMQKDQSRAKWAYGDDGDE